MIRKSLVDVRLRAGVHLRSWLLAAMAFVTLAVDADMIETPSLIDPMDGSRIDSESELWISLDLELHGSMSFRRALQAAAAENWDGVLDALAEENTTNPDVRKLRVLALTRLGQHSEAEQFLRELLDDSSELQTIAIELSTVLMWQGRLEEAEQILLESGANDQSDDPFMLAGLARLNAARGETQAAIRLYEQAIAIGPDASDYPRTVHVELARLLGGSGAYARVKRLLEPYANITPNTPPQRIAMLMLADAYLSLGDADAAKGVAEKLRDTGANRESDIIAARVAAVRGYSPADQTTPVAHSDAVSAQLHRQHYLLRRQAGDVDSAADALLAAFEVSNREYDAIQIMHELVNYLVENGRNDRAVTVVRNGMQRWPTSDDIAFLLSGTLYAVGRHDEGLEAVRALLSGRDDNAPARALYAKLLWSVGENQNAATEMRAVLDREPAMVQHWIELAYMQHHLANHKAMNGVIDAALGKNARDPALLVERARIHGAEGRTDEANAIYRGIIEQNQDRIPAYLYLAVSLAESGQDHAEALRLVVRANQLAPRDPVVRGTFGWVLCLNGDYEYGLFYLRQAVGALPARGLFRLRLADALIRAGTPQMALGELRRAKNSGLTAADLKKADDLIASLQ